MREMADRNQERIRKELETGPTVMIKVPSPHFILHLNGETYGARKSPYHGWVADVPRRLVDEISQIDIPLPGKKGNYVRFSFEIVTEPIGGAY